MPDSGFAPAPSSTLAEPAAPAAPPAAWISAACLAVVFPTLLAFNVPPSATFLNQAAAFVGWGCWALLLASSVSGFYLSHPESRYFTVGRLGRDQLQAYAARKAMPLAEVERWLGPNLGYEPETPV